MSFWLPNLFYAGLCKPSPLKYREIIGKPTLQIKEGVQDTFNVYENICVIVYDLVFRFCSKIGL